MTKRWTFLGRIGLLLGTIGVTFPVVLGIGAALPAALSGRIADTYVHLRPIVGDDADSLMRRLGPLPENGGLGAVPRQAPTRIPPDWADAHADDEARKAAFLRLVLPLVLTANEAIRAERQRLSAIVAAGGPSSPADVRWLHALARRYGTKADDYAGLMRRVDTVPTSLALAQAAIESGWGRSRFAGEGNALYGQWTWNAAAAIVPQDQRRGLGNYGIRRFRSLAASVSHYMLNRHRHRAYRDFRRTRAALRSAGWPVDGASLAPTLAQYSEHRGSYVNLLRRVIADNRLERFDAARLAPGSAFASTTGHDTLLDPARTTGS